MTYSFHKFRNSKNGKSFFPGTDHHSDAGTGVGKFFAVNVPLHLGIDDETFVSTFKAVIGEAMRCFKVLQAIVMQCGAECLGGDLHSLTLQPNNTGSWSMCQLHKGLIHPEHTGYAKTNVPRLWTYETAI